jgi:hypothetical protein
MSDYPPEADVGTAHALEDGNTQAGPAIARAKAPGLISARGGTFWMYGGRRIGTADAFNRNICPQPKAPAVSGCAAKSKPYKSVRYCGSEAPKCYLPGREK